MLTHNSYINLPVVLSYLAILSNNKILIIILYFQSLYYYHKITYTYFFFKLTLYLFCKYSTAPIKLFNITTSSLGTPILFELESNIAWHVGLQNVFVFVLFKLIENLNII